MEPRGEPVNVKVVPSVGSIGAEAWDACAGDADPFVSHAFLDALEESESANAENGWLPQHVVLESEDGKLLGCAPMYVKGHSYGEYVFDWSWARAWQQGGRRYYPKLQCCVPFTPVTGPRLLVHPARDATTIRPLLLAGMVELAKHHEVSSLHTTFCTKEEWEAGGELGLLQRRGIQYHWKNRDYGCYDDFLDDLKARKRKALRKERKRAQECGARVVVRCGDDIRAEHWDAFYEFYLSTIDRKWASAYLTREFFEIIGHTMPERIVLIMAELDGKPVAGAFNLLGRDALYGRYWGATKRLPFLHFEACYHRAIDEAIDRGLSRVEAGAQGQHKIQRGYMPVYTYSLHWIASPSFRDAIADFLVREKRGLAMELDELIASGPFRTGERTERKSRS